MWLARKEFQGSMRYPKIDDLALLPGEAVSTYLMYVHMYVYSGIGAIVDWSKLGRNGPSLVRIFADIPVTKPNPHKLITKCMTLLEYQNMNIEFRI